MKSIAPISIKSTPLKFVLLFFVITVVNQLGWASSLTTASETTHHEDNLFSDDILRNASDFHDLKTKNNVLPNSFGTNVMDSCEYTLQLYDSFGDGWNGAALTVTAGCVSSEYTVPPGGDSSIIPITLTSNDPIVFNYSPGTFENEITYNILDPMGNVIFSDGTFPQTGVVLEFFACPTCEGPTEVVLDDIFGLGADVSWTPSPTASSYNLEIGPVGFLPGSGTSYTTSDNFVSITGLDENTPYDFYVTGICDNGDESGYGCPNNFTTTRLNDVGIIAITSPLTACGLSNSETITVQLQNFGSNPQSLVTFKYSVNGVEAPIQIPLDGFYTNIIGNDSIETLEFQTTWDFSQPGDYEIAAWTELDGDSDLTNDTAYFSVINIPTISGFPFTQNFEDGNGGWTVSDDSQNQTWDFGEPIGGIINSAASGINAWVTNLSGNYNGNELSYIVSNCFDFSTLTIDPAISFSINFDTQNNFDGAWLESSIDGGNTWEVVGTMGTGINWYTSNSFTFGDIWSGNSGGWTFAKNTLVGTAGESDVLLRFAFASNGFTNFFDGVGIDDISVFIPVVDDMASQAVINSSTMICGDPMDELTLTIVNNGTATQSGFDVSYQVNGGLVVTENVGALTLGPDEIGSYTFSTPFNSAITGLITINSWTELPGELNISNDTTTYSFATFRLLPFKEDFEGQTLPNGWTSDEFNPIGNGHGNISYVASDNLWSADPSFELISPPIGPITTGDSLFFDYRFVDFFGGGNDSTTLGNGDLLNIEISTDCGVTYSNLFTVDQTNHSSTNMMTTLGFDISNFDGESILIRFEGIHATGDYYLDIDNINIFQCGSLDLTTESTPELDEQINGTATVIANANAGPYTYSWDFGATTATVTGLEDGEYSVTVTDAFGCSDMTTVAVGMGTNTIEIEKIQSINLFPNPTTDIATLEMIFNESVDLQVQLINMMGQVVFEKSITKTSEERFELNLNNFPTGMYFVRINVDNQSLVKKLSKVQP